LKVLHIAAGNLFGGVETLLVTLARERRLCPEMKPHFSVCFEERLSRELRATGAPVDYMGSVKARNPFTIFRARSAMERLLSEEKIDVAICHSPWPLAIFGPVVKSHNIPLVYWNHGFLTGRHWLELWAQRTVPALAIANSRATAKTVERMFPQVPLQTIYYPVSRTAPARSGAGNPVVILQVSRMEKWKGHEILLNALATLTDLPDWVCWVVGGAQNAKEAQYEAGLHNKTEQLDLIDRVDFLGSRSDVADLMSEADIFCQTNESPEPFGIVFIEALHASLPVVTCRMGGAQEIVDSSCGVLVEPDSREVASALRRLITRPDERASLGAAGPARAIALCDPERQLGKLRETLQALF
jgi:glycosyltransferase involved in cell wall biosynthesis